MFLVWVVSLSLTAISPQIYAEESTYTRKVSYENEIVLRCPDKNKATVQVLQAHADVWYQGKESIDMRLDRRVFDSVQEDLPECTVIIENLEIYVQAAEAKMYSLQKAGYATNQSNSSYNFQKYLNYEDTVNWYKRLAEDNPDLVTFIPSIGETYEGRKMPCIHFTASKDPKRKKFYMQCQVHAREWISGATCMYLTHQFVTNYGKDKNITNLMDNLEFVIVPIVNPDGYVYSWTDDRYWRKNRANINDNCVGVDINRNFPEGFRYNNFPICGDDFGGPKAESEMETVNIIKNFRSNTPIIGSIDFHTFGGFILRPWGNQITSPPDESFLRDVADEMVELIKAVNGAAYTSEHSHDLYPSYGLAADWLYGNDSASTNGGYRSASYCIEMGDSKYNFLVPEDQILPTVKEIVPAVVYFAQAVLLHPLISQPSRIPPIIYDKKTF